MPRCKQTLNVCCTTDDQTRKCTDFENIYQILSEENLKSCTNYPATQDPSQFN